MEKDRIISRGIPTSADAQAACHRHSFAVRCTHWIFAAAFFVLVFSSLPILIAHPRFYWGETGALGTHPLFVLPLPLWVGRSGWGRSLHFLAAWVALFAGIVYVVSGVFSGHFRRRLVPTRADLTWSNLRRVTTEYLSRSRGELKDSLRYNVAQRIAYLFVVFVLFPLIILTGLAMSPAITSVAPWLVEMFGGHQSARTLHFIFSQLLEAFFIVHLVMVARAGFVSRTKSMIVADASPQDFSALHASGVSFTPEASFTSKGVADA
jgi:thiosulfate reductase cytochrome b subunit